MIHTPEQMAQAKLFLSEYGKEDISINGKVNMLLEFVDYVGSQFVLTIKGGMTEEEKQHFIEEWKKSSGTIIYKAPERKISYLLFGKDVCHAMEDGIDEVLALIDDGADYDLIETDGADIASLLDKCNGCNGYAFLTKEEYDKILNHD
jgi:hypothetical protein